MVKFSLILCIYAEESPLFLSECLDGILKQTVLPDEFIIVKDGPLTNELNMVLDSLIFPNELKIIALSERVTQGLSRAEGVKAAIHDWIAIIDSDDICLPDRFEKQLEMIEENPELGLIGGQISEFMDDPAIPLAIRSVPTEHYDIVRFLKKRNPFSQMTVMFRRDLALVAGNYRSRKYCDDYDLWMRMIKNGVICANHKDVLVNARVGGGMYGRRRGMAYVKIEWLMQRQMKELGLINNFEFLRNIFLRIPVRLLPAKVVKIVYLNFVRKKIG